MAYWGYDPYADQRPPPPPHNASDYYRHGTSTYLYPGYNGEGGLHRSRSQGHRPAPTVMVVNENVNESSARSASRSPPYPLGRYSPEGARGRRSSSRRRLGDELAEEVAELLLDKEERERSRRRDERLAARSRSRGHSDADFIGGGLGGGAGSEFRDWELLQKERELRELQRKDQWEAEKKRLRADFEAEQVKNEAKKRADEDAAKEEKRRIIDDYERKQREDKEDRIAEEKRIKEKLEREAREAKAKEKEEWEEFLRKQRELEEKEKEDKKKEKEKVDEATRKRLLAAGMSYAAVERILDDEKKQSKALAPPPPPQSPFYDPGRPKYSKIHKRYLDVKTLKYHQIPYTLSNDPDYIIILCSLDQDQIDLLCNHTRKLRSGDKTLLLEAKKEPKGFSFFRSGSGSRPRRDRSVSRGKEGYLVMRGG